jgi:hypothetical protein
MDIAVFLVGGAGLTRAGSIRLDPQYMHPNHMYQNLRAKPCRQFNPDD